MHYSETERAENENCVFELLKLTPGSESFLPIKLPLFVKLGPGHAGGDDGDDEEQLPFVF